MYIFAPFPAIAISVAKVPARLTMDLLEAMDRMYVLGGVFGSGISSSPRGGGPGHSPISTSTPPSVEEVGRIITGTVSPKTGKRSWERCPHGYYWDGKKCRKVGTGPNWY